MDVVIVYETDAQHSKASRNVVAVCSSKRAAISLVVNDLLEKKIIEPKDIATYRNELNEKSQTQGLDNNFLLTETTVNKFIQ